MSNEKTYVGGAKEMTGNYGVFHKISFSAQDLETLKSHLNAKGYVNLAMNQRQSPSQYGQTHSLVIDTWQPTPQGQAPQAPQQFQQPQQQPFQQGAPIPQEFQQVAQQPQQFQQPQQQPQVGF
jgi:hypothetical protein